MSNNSLPCCVVLIDVKNISPNIIGGLMRQLKSRYTITQAIGFADFGQPEISNTKAALRRLGITLRHVPSLQSGRFRKSLVDQTLMIEMMMIHAHCRNQIDAYVLVSGDGHFVPMVQALRRDGKRVIVAAPRQSSSRALRRVASQFFTVRMHARKSSASTTLPGIAPRTERPQ